MPLVVKLYPEQELEIDGKGVIKNITARGIQLLVQEGLKVTRRQTEWQKQRREEAKE